MPDITWQRMFMTGKNGWMQLMFKIGFAIYFLEISLVNGASAFPFFIIHLLCNAQTHHLTEID